MPTTLPRIETIFLPYHIHAITGKQVWSLAAKELFEVPVLHGILDRLGAVSTHDPLRNEKILTTLLSGRVQWIIFPEGMMVKNKKLVRNKRFFLEDDTKKMRPHTGAAVQALRCEFFRERLRRLSVAKGPEFERLIGQLGIAEGASGQEKKGGNTALDGSGPVVPSEVLARILGQETFIVPVNITYYPTFPRENILGAMARILVKTPSKRVMDELMTEGAMLFAGVDITIRFGAPIPIRPYLNDPYIESMLRVRRRVRFDEDIYSKAITRDLSGRIMERYMADVYTMTTLNYDHVMACILKHYPYQKKGIDIYEFKCKVYYAITCLVLNRICCVVDTFYHNQVHILTDDRYQRVKRFLDLAEATGVVRIENNRMVKDQTRFFTSAPFHAIRLENPVLVMANEVEPVVQAEICLKKIAQKSRRQILARVNSRLVEKMNVDYSKAYNQFYIEGESKSKRVGRPIFLKQAGHGAVGVLLIHGYMAAPREMKAFAEYLHSKGFTVFAPRLAGHGTAPEDLAQTRYEQWIESVEEAYAVLANTCTKVVIGGFSTGAGLALELACRVNGFEAVFAVAPPMRLKDLGAYFVPAVDAWNAVVKRLNLGAGAKEFIDNVPENPHINYVRNPIAGVHQLEKLMERLAPNLKTITPAGPGGPVQKGSGGQSQRYLETV